MEFGATTALAAAGLAYVAGSIPFGYLTARVVTGEDIRQAGSGNIGATNVARVLGARWGIVVLIFDALKGFLPTWLIPQLMNFPAADVPHASVLCGVATIVGHMFPVWLRFRGGKGVATALGVVATLGWQAMLVALVVFILSMLLTRIVSLSSILAAVAYAIAALVVLGPAAFSRQTWSVAAFSLLIPALIILRHRTNLVRLWKGEEKRLEFGRRRQ